MLRDSFCDHNSKRDLWNKFESFSTRHRQQCLAFHPIRIDHSWTQWSNLETSPQHQWLLEWLWQLLEAARRSQRLPRPSFRGPENIARFVLKIVIISTEMLCCLFERNWAMFSCLLISQNKSRSLLSRCRTPVIPSASCRLSLATLRPPYWFHNQSLAGCGRFPEIKVVQLHRAARFVRKCRSNGWDVCGDSSTVQTCFPVNPWQITLVDLFMFRFGLVLV